MVTKYIGPLEEIVRTYQLARLKDGQVNYTLKRKDLRLLAKAITQSVVNLIERSRRHDGGLEPPAGFEPATTGLQGRRSTS